MKNVVLLSPSRFSLYTICVTELLRRSGVNVQAVIVRRLLNPRRFLAELTTDRARLAKRIWRKLILREASYRGPSPGTIADLMRQENIRIRDVAQFKKRFGTPVTYCSTLNDAVVVDALRRLKPDVVLFTGGGLIRKDVLENSGAGVLNCHMGVLPRYRGMDVAEWAILEGNPDQVGVSVHFMDRGIDTGDILRVEETGIEGIKNVQQLQDSLEPIMCRQIVSTCLDYLAGNVKRRNQSPEEGRQYFSMHPRLLRIVSGMIHPTQ